MTVDEPWSANEIIPSDAHSNFLAQLHFLGSQPGTARLPIRLIALISGTLFLAMSAGAQSPIEQSSLPFAVSNPRHLDWSMEQAGRIYSTACELVARSIRPERPPHLQPKFILVLGADQDETVRRGDSSEVLLKKWNPVHFAEAMVLMATREVLKGEDLEHLTRDTLLAAQATVSVTELKQKK